jgi:2'-5' RNA ligase
VRLFLALDLDEATRRAVVDWMRALADQLGARYAPDIKWVAPENLHLTLLFFGYVDPTRADEIHATLAGQPFQAASPPHTPPAPFELRIGGAGTFPPSGPARVIWLGVDDERRRFVTLHHDVQNRLAPIGAADPPDARPFNPHLTLGRVRTPTAALGRALKPLLASAPSMFGRVAVRHLTLYESRLSSAGPTYIEIDRIPVVPAGSADT